jgi:hypothetical protein
VRPQVQRHVDARNSRDDESWPLCRFQKVIHAGFPVRHYNGSKDMTKPLVLSEAMRSTTFINPNLLPLPFHIPNHTRPSLTSIITLSIHITIMPPQMGGPNANHAVMQGPWDRLMFGPREGNDNLDQIANKLHNHPPTRLLGNATLAEDEREVRRATKKAQKARKEAEKA